MTVRTMNMPAHFLLQSGDRLSRDEFERRYHAMPEVKKAELLEGEVHMASPVSFQYHGQHEFALATLFGVYVSQTEGVFGSPNTTVRLDLDNEPQPDQILFLEPSHGGQVEIDGDGYITGAPELVVEVSGSTVSIDLGKKLNVYRRNGVKEYVVWRVFDEAIDWFCLRNGNFEILEPDSYRVVKSLAFPGLWLDTNAMLAGDLKAVLTTLQLGLNSPHHADFVSRLAAAKK